MSTDASAAIATVNKELSDAFGRGDAAGMAAVYTTDAILLPPGVGSVTGTSAITGFWQSVLDAGGTSLALETVALSQHGDVAREIGGATLTVSDGSTTTTSPLAYVVFWLCTPEGWRYETDIWNDDAPGVSAANS